MKYLQTSIKLLLLATALTPLVLTRDTIFPFIFGKMVFFRSIIEIALILFIIYLLLFFYQHKSAVISINQRLINVIKNPLFILIILFFISLIISTVFAVNPYRAFWGDTERAEGLFGMFHCLVFLIMTVLIFKKKDWLNYFKISLFAGLIVMFYGFLEYIGFFWYPSVANFPFMALTPTARPSSYIGNPAFLATYMIFIIAFAVIVFYQHKSAVISINQRLSKLWKYFSLIMIVLAIAMIFITGTRGAILGLGAGIFSLLVYFAFKKQSISINLKSLSISLRKLSLFLLLLMILFGSIFWFTRSNDVWQKIPGLNRLAQTAVFDLNDSSTQMRLMNWKISWEAFKEKPIFGWGLENFLLAYQKNYDPNMALYGETWIDRAHNKIIDLAVMQGVFGLLTYLLMFGGIFFILFRKKSTLIYADDKLIYADKKSPFLMAILIAYFVQNLVLFDQLTSYIFFFAVLGFLISKTLIYADDKLIYADEKSESISQNQNQSAEISINQRTNIYKLPILILLSSIIFGIGYVLYFYNYIPYTQAKAFKESSEICRGKDLTEEECVNLITEKAKKAMYPYNFAQYNIRGQGVDAYYLNQYFYQIELIQNLKFEPLADLLIKGQEEIIKKEPYDVRLFIREVEMLNPKAVNNPELYKKTENLIRQALEIAPKRQELYYNLAFALSGQERYEESIEIARYALSLSPNVARAHYHLGLMFYLANRNEEAAEKLNIAEELKPDFNSFLPGDLNNIALIYTNWGKIDKVAELITKELDGKIAPIGFGFKREYYEVALRYYAIIHNKENLIKVASYLTYFQDAKEKMEVLIDLAEKENWEIIDNL